MAALSANRKDVRIKDVGNKSTLSAVVKSAAVIYEGALVSHDSTTGEYKPFDGTQADRVVGIAMDGRRTPVTGNASGARERVSVKPGEVLWEDLTVGGLSNDATDVGAPVYATDDGTFTITDPGSGQVLGWVWENERRASGKADVYFRNLLET